MPSATLLFPSSAVPCEMRAQYIMFLKSLQEGVRCGTGTAVGGHPRGVQRLLGHLRCCLKALGPVTLFLPQSNPTTSKCICAVIRDQLHVAVWH